MLIILKLSLEFYEPFLKIGVESTNLKTDGKVPSLTEALHKRWRTSEKMSVFFK